MELDWSAQSPHIRTLFRPWQPGDGYDEAEIQKAETRLGIRLPTKLRNFYLAWGKRKDVTEVQNPLLPPDELEILEDTLLFWVENQAVIYWGIPCEAFEETDPSVVLDASAPRRQLNWEPSHAHLSNFLDDVAYLHALLGGAVHGGWSDPGLPELSKNHIAWLEEHWSKAPVGPWIYGVDFGPAYDAWPALYVRDGQAFYSLSWHRLVACDVKVLDEISQRFQITWRRRW